MNLTHDYRRSPRCSGVAQAGTARYHTEDQCAKEVMCAVIRQTLTDFAHMVLNGMVSEDSWLVMSEKGRAVGIKHDAEGNRYPAGSNKAAAAIAPKEMRECLVFLGGREIDHICEWIGSIHADEVRRAAVRMHAAWAGQSRIADCGLRIGGASL
jgi:hypothetical protein